MYNKIISQTLFYRPQYGFARLMTKLQKKELKSNQFNWKHNFIYDDLYFAHDQSHQNGGIQALMDEVKVNKLLQMDPKGISILMYNMGIKNQKDRQVNSNVEKQLYQFKDNFTPRLAFGGLYGSLKCDASEYFITYFQDVFLKLKEYISAYECLELIEAYEKNSTLPIYQKQTFIEIHLLPIIINNFKKDIRVMPTVVIRLFHTCNNFQLYNQELWEKIIITLITKKSINKLETLTDIYETFVKIQNSGKFYRSLKNEINFFQSKLNSKADFKWRYNVDEQRFYTYKELKKKRENYQFKGQSLSLITKFHIQGLQKYKEVLEYQSGKEKEQEQKQLEKDLNQEILQKFMVEQEKIADMIKEKSQKEIFEEQKKQNLEIKKFKDKSHFTTFKKTASQKKREKGLNKQKQKLLTQTDIDKADNDDNDDDQQANNSDQD